MPTYQYRCTECGNDLEIVQKFSDASLTVCPTCSGELRKVFNAVGVVFKGSGFYRTDSRSTSDSSIAAANSSTDKPEKSEQKSEPSVPKAEKKSESSTSATTPSTSKAAAAS